MKVIGKLTKKMELVNNFLNWLGKLNAANGDVYSGQWRDDSKSGKGSHFAQFIGTQINDNKDKYEGLWRNGNKDGVGTSFP